MEKNHDVTAAGTEDFCLVRGMQHHVAGPQELAHPGRGNGKCRGDQPSRLSCPASCRVPERWKLKAPVLSSLPWVPAMAPAPGGTPGGTGGTPVLPSCCRTRGNRSAAETGCNAGAAPQGGNGGNQPTRQSMGSTRAPRVVFRATRKTCPLSAKRLIDPHATVMGARAGTSGKHRPSRLTDGGF